MMPPAPVPPEAQHSLTWSRRAGGVEVRVRRAGSLRGADGAVLAFGALFLAGLASVPWEGPGGFLLAVAVLAMMAAAGLRSVTTQKVQVDASGVHWQQAPATPWRRLRFLARSGVEAIEHQDWTSVGADGPDPQHVVVARRPDQTVQPLVDLDHDAVAARWVAEVLHAALKKHRDER